MNAIFFLMGQFDCKLSLSIGEVCEAIGYAKQTAYNEIRIGAFPVPMQKRAGKWMADIRDVADFLDAARASARAEHNLLRGRLK